MDQDPFNLSQRKVIGPYKLEQFESGKYYLRKSGAEDNGGGCIEGTVERIGWTKDFIFAERHSTYRGDPDGWMIIDTRNGSISGPLPENEFKKRYPGVQPLTSQEAWKKL